ncbi:hypothetical protein GCM10010182_67660 [Actinomadura cremea]|nr:hypothetical protein GCM10010182_67660 [Actinomadura cremea]
MTTGEKTMAAASEAKKAVDAATAEAENKSRTITFGEGDDAAVFELPRKWKRFRFMRALARGDMSGCLDAIWPPSKEKDPITGQPVSKPHPIVEQIEDLDIDEDEFEAAFEALGSALGGTSVGNSNSSPA